MSERNVTIETPDGEAGACFFFPEERRAPAVLLWPDMYGLRPAYAGLGRRLAEAGYAALIVNPYYRTMKGSLVPEGTTVIDPELRAELFPRAKVHAAELSAETTLRDGKAFLDFFARHPGVDTEKKVGVIGFCMTGAYSFRLAAALPDRIGAGVSLHGGGLVTDRPESPHRLIPSIQAEFFVAIAEDDDTNDPEAKSVLRKAFESAHVPAEVEVYSGTRHGFCAPDSAVYHAAQAERVWQRVLDLFARRLG